jgi:hypothetical protein
VVELPLAEGCGNSDDGCAAVRLVGDLRLLPLLLLLVLSLLASCAVRPPLAKGAWRFAALASR